MPLYSSHRDWLLSWITHSLTYSHAHTPVRCGKSTGNTFDAKEFAWEYNNTHRASVYKGEMKNGNNFTATQLLLLSWRVDVSVSPSPSHTMHNGRSIQKLPVCLCVVEKAYPSLWVNFTGEKIARQDAYMHKKYRANLHCISIASKCTHMQTNVHKKYKHKLT